MKIIAIVSMCAVIFLLGSILVPPPVIMIVEYWLANLCRDGQISEDHCVMLSMKTTFVNPSRYLKDE